MSYDATLSRDTDKVRLMIGDTDASDEMLHDLELQYFLTTYTDLRASAAAACRVIAARFARDVNYRFSTLWQDASDAYKHYMKLADSLDAAAGTEDMEGPVFTSSTNFESGNPIFIIGMDDNPNANTDYVKEYYGET